jgi:hypothetical protein
MPYLLVTAANWSGEPGCVTSLPSWSCGFDSRRPLQPESPAQSDDRDVADWLSVPAEVPACHLRAISRSHADPSPSRSRADFMCSSMAAVVARSAPRVSCSSGSFAVVSHARHQVVEPRSSRGGEVVGGMPPGPPGLAIVVVLLGTDQEGETTSCGPRIIQRLWLTSAHLASAATRPEPHGQCPDHRLRPMEWPRPMTGCRSTRRPGQEGARPSGAGHRGKPARTRR